VALFFLGPLRKGQREHVLELIVLNPGPRKRRSPKKKKRKVRRRATSRTKKTSTKKKRRKTAKKKKRKPVARKKTRTRRKRTTRKKARRKPRRRKAPRRKARKRRNPRRRKAPRRRARARKRPVRRRRRRRNAPKRRRTASRRRRPVRRRRRSTRRRRNPARGMGLRGLTRQIRNVFTVKTLTNVSQTLLGAGLSIAIPPMAAKAIRQPWITRGYAGVVSTAVAAVIASAGASALGFRGAAPRILAGGLLVAGSQGLRMILPPAWKRWIPQIGGSSGYGGYTRPATRFPGVSGAMGQVLTSDQLVAGEGRARQLGDWFSMDGVGAGYGPMGQAYNVPRASIAGGGMGDYMYFAQTPSVAAPIGIPAFSPSPKETF
jgi:hypothetical protein